jgi:hypothetical protein
MILMGTYTGITITSIVVASWQRLVMGSAKIQQNDNWCPPDRLGVLYKYILAIYGSNR